MCCAAASQSRGIVRVLSVIYDLRRMRRGYRARVTSSGVRQSQRKHLPPLLLLQIQYWPLSLPPSLPSLMCHLSPLISLYSYSFVSLYLHPPPFLHIFPPPPSSSFDFLFLFQIVICGQRDSPDTAGLLTAVYSLFLPHKVSVWKSDASSWQMCHRSLKQP